MSENTLKKIIDKKIGRINKLKKIITIEDLKKKLLKISLI